MRHMVKVDVSNVLDPLVMKVWAAVEGTLYETLSADGYLPVNKVFP